MNYYYSIISCKIIIIIIIMVNIGVSKPRFVAGVPNLVSNTPSTGIARRPVFSGNVPYFNYNIVPTIESTEIVISFELQL